MFYTIHEVVSAWKEGLLDRAEARAAIFAIINRPV